ncbi:Holliday junction resolvase RuvX [Patescibacteria group bacterium]|nr:Holliday junction resolvase RuvX [Patescibacteria group bacterium]
MSKLLGIDYGQAKCGLALADSDVKTAVPLDVVSLNDLGFQPKADQPLAGRIKDLIESEEIEKIVVGLPLGLDGRETAQTKEVREFIKNLKLKTDIEIVAEDERLTTAQAKRSGHDDAVAAMYILQSYLDKLNKKHKDNQ